MSNLSVTPILFHYDFLDSLCLEAASLLSLNISNEKIYHQFKLSVFLNFNRYLMDSILFLPEGEAERLLADLSIAMKEENEVDTLNMLENKFESLAELRSDFLNIIKTLKK